MKKVFAALVLISLAAGAGAQTGPADSGTGDSGGNSPLLLAQAVGAQGNRRPPAHSSQPRGGPVPRPVGKPQGAGKGRSSRNMLPMGPDPGKRVLGMGEVTSGRRMPAMGQARDKRVLAIGPHEQRFKRIQK